MKYLPLKLAIGIIVVFGALLVGMALYMPLWFRYYGWRLESPDAATREAAAKALTARGEDAMPHIRKWLQYRNTNRVTGACLVLEKMKGGTWTEALPELEKILSGRYSEKTNAAAAAVYTKGRTCTKESYFSLSWKYFSDLRIAKRNICIYILSNENDSNMRSRVAGKLGWAGDSQAVEPLMHSLENDTDLFVRGNAANSLGEIGDRRAVALLINALKNDPDSHVRWQAAGALGEIGDTVAVDQLIAALENDSDSHVRKYTADALGKIGDKRAVDQLIRALLNDSNKIVRMNAAKSLGKIKNERAVKPLIASAERDTNDSVSWMSINALGEIGATEAVEFLIQVLKQNPNNELRGHAAYSLGKIGDIRALQPLINTFANNKDEWVRAGCANALGKMNDKRAIEPLISALHDSSQILKSEAIISLARYKDERVYKALSAISEKNMLVSIVLAWHKGDKHIKHIDEIEIVNACSCLHVLRAVACARHGHLERAGDVIYSAPGWMSEYKWFCKDIFNRMPDGFPVYDFNSNYATRKKQREVMQSWYIENKHQLAWDEEGRRYYLRR
jgi:HEAT repeat protein